MSRKQVALAATKGLLGCTEDPSKRTHRNIAKTCGQVVCVCRHLDAGVRQMNNWGGLWSVPLNVSYMERQLRRVWKAARGHGVEAGK